MKNTILKITIALSIFFNYSCTSQVVLNNKKESSPKKMEDLSVTDNFQYRNLQKVDFNFAIENLEGKPISKALFSFLGIESNNKENIFYSGITKEDGSVKIVLNVPHHFEKVQIRVSKNNVTQNFDYPLELLPSQQKLIFK